MTGDDDQTTAEEWAEVESVVFSDELGVDVERIDVFLKKLYHSAITLIGNIQSVDATKDITPCFSPKSLTLPLITYL